MERRLSPVPRKSTIGYIASFFEKRKKIDTFERPQYSKEESAAEDELFNRGLSQTHIFSYKQLKKATNGFKQEIGTGGYGTVYLGQLQDNRMVAVKVLYDRNKKRREQFINEVLLLSRLCHPNLVNLYGCVNPQTDPASRELILVYEFVPNGTLADHLYGQLLPLSWPRRLQIAVETAEALTYLHSAETPVIHRDVKPENILLDNAFHVKVADFGMSRFLPSDGTQLSTLTPGTQGYHDPEYEKVYMLTEKSDVYSFGVVLVELISREKAVDVDRAPDNVYLAGMAYKMIINNELEQLVDPELGYHSNDEVRRTINSVAELAYRCLQQSGNMRPSMLDVFDILKGLQSEMQLEVQESKQEEPQGLCPPTVYSYKELEKATNCFNAAGLIGEGSIYKIYLGILQDGRMAAVKVYQSGRLETFLNEVTILTRTRHKNLVALYGYTNPTTRKNLVTLYNYSSPATKKLMIVEEFLPNGTLADHLFGQRPALPLVVRIEIAIEVATALEYLHSLQPSVIHRDVKARNILLDNDFHAKVHGLDICHIMTEEATSEPVALAGTFGYMAPESVMDGIVTAKSDIYGFGMVLFELIWGKRALDIMRNKWPRDEWVFADIINNELDELADPKLGYHSNNETRRTIQELAELARICARRDSSERPSMAQVLATLKALRSRLAQLAPELAPWLAQFPQHEA